MAVGYLPVDLLIPAHRTEELGSKFIFRFQVIGERARIADLWNLKKRFIRLAPKLNMMPRKTKILTKDDFAIIAQSGARSQRGIGGVAEIGASAE